MSDLKTIWKKYSGIDKQELIILFGLALRQSKEFILSHTDYQMSYWERWRLWRLVRRHKNGWPTAYLAGHKEFCGLDFLVNKNTLIPRSSTEAMVELVLEQLGTPKQTLCVATGQTVNCPDFASRKIEDPQFQPNWNRDEPRTVLIDIGTGTGCIPIAIKKSLEKENSDVKSEPRPCVGVIATDISKKALRVAKQNAERHNVDIQFIRGDLLKPIIKYFKTNLKSEVRSPKSVLITANLPYLTKEWIKSEPGIQKEPRSALLADNKNGLSLYEKLFQQIQFISLMANCSMLILVEIDSRQSETALALAKKYFTQSTVEIKKDLGGKDRIMVIKIL